MTAGVYKIVFVPTGRMYVGSSADVELRLSKHFGALKRGKHHNAALQRAWDAHGQGTFKTEIIVEVREEAERLAEETRQINLHDALVSRGGFNIAKEAGKINRRTTPLCAEHREKIAAANKGKMLSNERKRKISVRAKARMADPVVRENLRLKRLGTKLSGETKQKVASSSKGRKHAPEAIEKCRSAALRRWSDPVRGAELRAIFEVSKRKGERPAQLSVEHKAAIGRASKGRRHSDETKAKLRDAARLRTPPEMTPERRAKIAEAQRVAWARRRGI